MKSAEDGAQEFLSVIAALRERWAVGPAGKAEQREFIGRAKGQHREFGELLELYFERRPFQ